MLFKNDDFNDVTFQNLSLGQETLAEKTFIACKFVNCSFQKTSLTDCVFEDCRFEGCGFVLAKLKGIKFKGAVFENCKLVGLEFNSDSLGIFLASFSFIRSRLMSCSFSHLDMSGIVSFCGSSFSETTFDTCRLKKTDFSNAEFERTNFLNCDLSMADFRNACGFGIDPRDNKLSKTKFSYINAIELLACFNLDFS